ncbi:MAG: hypothetical protein RLZZ399_1604 [Verrucomicrobiota bacterium]|jgi:hypothetical protein
MSFYTSSFIQIIHYVSEALVQCDANTKLAELFGDEFDDVDFELALCCFEATHRLAFRDELQTVTLDQYEDLTIEEFLETYLDPQEQADALFVAKRFRMFEEALTRALVDEGQDSREY